MPAHRITTIEWCLVDDQGLTSHVSGLFQDPMKPASLGFHGDPGILSAAEVNSALRQDFCHGQKCLLWALKSRMTLFYPLEVRP